MSAAKRVTIADIAREAGVSPGAVSFALNGRPGVSEETRQRILAVAERHSWQPSSTARALVGARAGVIGLAVNRPPRTLGAEAFFTDLIAGIESALEATALGLNLRIVRSIDDEVGTYRQWDSNHQVDGVIVLDPREDDPRLAELAERGMKAVVIGSRPAEPGAASTVWLDDEAVAHTLFEYLAAVGHRKIGYVTGAAELLHTRLRVGALESLSDRGVAAQVIATDTSPAQSADATRQLLSRLDPPTAIVYDNDVMAVSAIRVAEEMAITVPEDVSIASFDDSVVAGLVRPSITCLTRDTFELGEAAAKLLLAQIDSDEPLPSVRGPQPRLTVRESTAAVR